MVGTARPLRSCLFHSWSQCGFSTALFSAAGTGTVDHRGRHTGLGTRVGGGLKTWLEFLAVMPWVLAEGAKLFRVFLELGTSVAWSEQMPTWQGTRRTADPRLGDQATDTVGAAGSSHNTSHDFSL